MPLSTKPGANHDLRTLLRRTRILGNGVYPDTGDAMTLDRKTLEAAAEIVEKCNVFNAYPSTYKQLADNIRALPVESNEGETPETDAKLFEAKIEVLEKYTQSWDRTVDVVDVDFARSLERQRNAAMGEQRDAERLKWYYTNIVKSLIDFGVHPTQYPTLEEWIANIDAEMKKGST